MPILPRGLITLEFGNKFDQIVDGTTLPRTLENLTFGWDFNQFVPTEVDAFDFSPFQPNIVWNLG